MVKRWIQNKNGFTLLELVIIIVIAVFIGVMLIPVFSRVHNNNVRIVNQANIRAAMEASEKDFISGSFQAKYTKNDEEEIHHFNYYKYDTSTKTIDRLSLTKREDGIPLGIEAAEEARFNRICSFIMVYAGYSEDGKLELMTAPFYNEDGVVLYYNNPYGHSRGTD